MHNVHDNVLSCIGDTPVVRLHKVARGLASHVYVKLEYLNPGGSMKDRIAVQIIDDAEKAGLLKPGGTIVEATSGNTGAGLALVAAIRGYTCIFVLPDKQSEEKRAALRAYGAKVVITPTDVEPEDPRSYYSTAKRIAQETPNAFYANQYHNPSNPEAHYRWTGPELWKQMDGRIDAFIAGLGTGGTISGIARYLEEQKPGVRIVGVDPVGSLYYDYFRTGQLTQPFSYVVEGIGEDFLPSTMDFTVVDEVVRVHDKECFQMTRRLAREEGVFAGVSSGAAVAGALKWVRSNDRAGANVVILLPDSGSRYLSKVYNDQWMAEHGFLEEEPASGTVATLLADRRPVVTVPDMIPATEAVALLKTHGISQVPVLRDGTVVGILHEKALLEAALRHDASARAGDLATLDFCVVDPSTDIAVVSDLLRRFRIALVMDEKEKLAGVLTRIDLIDHLARRAVTGTLP